MSELEHEVVNVPNFDEDGVDSVAEVSSNKDVPIRESRLAYLAASAKAEILCCMQRGYEEMGRINLRIAAESFLVEQEAGGTVERLVSGV